MHLANHTTYHRGYIADMLPRNHDREEALLAFEAPRHEQQVPGEQVELVSRT
jgi:uncharacterized damage-inducible protein DinB